MTVDKSLPILVVDDFQTMVRIMRNLLELLGFDNIDEANDGKEALVKLQQGSYGLVISDWSMKPMTGFDLLRKVRADQTLADLPFIMLTTDSHRENVGVAKKAGANDHIMKPFNTATLKDKIESVLGDTSR